jgi:adenine-specific DNA-methyltransferase
MPKLDWLTRNEDEKVSAHVPYRLLEAVPEHSYGDPGSENMLIQGDNLDALKALLPFYAGRVKCIFIDPPYNTRSAFEHYDDNLEHTQWLAMIYPRLELLRDLLRDDGSIWVTMDDNEAHYLKVLMDEIFGRKNFVANVIWQKRFSPNSTAQYISDSHDHILVYARTKASWKRNLLPRDESQNASYKNPDNDPRGPWTSGDLSARNSYSLGIYPIEAPSGRVIAGPPKGMYWRVSKEKFRELDKDHRIWWGKDGNNVPRLKRFLTDVMQGIVPQTIWLHGEVGNTQEAKKEAMAATSADADVFQTPKPERLIRRVLELSSEPGELVLDAFLGSGTTAAVAHKMNRPYIAIEFGEQAITHCAPRLKKVVDGEQGGISEAVSWKGGGGYHFYKLGNPVFDEEGRINPAVRFAHLAAHVWFAETRTPLPHPKRRSPLLGAHEGVGYYLLFNGILGDKRPDGGNVLTRRLLAELPAPHDGTELVHRVIYGESSRLSKESLLQLGITFKQTPYDVKAR